MFDTDVDFFLQDVTTRGSYYPNKSMSTAAVRRHHNSSKQVFICTNKIRTHRCIFISQAQAKTAWIALLQRSMNLSSRSCHNWSTNDVSAAEIKKKSHKLNAMSMDE